MWLSIWQRKRRSTWMLLSSWPFFQENILTAKYDPPLFLSHILTGIRKVQKAIINSWGDGGGWSTRLCQNGSPNMIAITIRMWIPVITLPLPNPPCRTLLLDYHRLRRPTKSIFRKYICMNMRRKKLLILDRELLHLLVILQVFTIVSK